MILSWRSSSKWSRCLQLNIIVYLQGMLQGSKAGFLQIKPNNTGIVSLLQRETGHFRFLDCQKRVSPTSPARSDPSTLDFKQLWEIWQITENHLPVSNVVMICHYQQLRTKVMILWCWLLTFRVCPGMSLLQTTSRNEHQNQTGLPKNGRYPTRHEKTGGMAMNAWTMGFPVTSVPDFQRTSPCFNCFNSCRGLGGSAFSWFTLPQTLSQLPWAWDPEQPRFDDKNSVQW